MFRTPEDGFFPDFLRAQNIVRVIEGKIIKKMSWGETKIGSSYQEFELSRFRVMEGKITVNVWRQSRGNRFWFELARGSSYRGFELSGVDCIYKHAQYKVSIKG